MAIYHATTKPISRSSGRSATASSAYRAGVEITDERTGLTHDYSKRGGVVMSRTFVVKDGKAENIDRSELWNKAEQAENRKDARTAREWIVAIPNELIPKDTEAQKTIGGNDGAKSALIFAKELARRYGVGVDVAIHSPDKEGDNRNWHAHIMTTTREVNLSEDGKIELGDKTSIELSNTKRKSLGLGSTSAEIKELRELWSKCANKYLEAQGHEARIDHRSYKEQGIEKQPTIKMGWQASAMERRGIATDRGDINRAIKAENKQIRGLQFEIIKLERQQKEQRHAPPPIEQKTVKQQNTSTSTAEAIEAKRQQVQAFRALCQEKAEQYHKSQLQEIRDKGKPLFAEIEQMKNSKPLNPLKRNEWRENLDKKIEEHNKLKATHDEMKAKGVTPKDLEAIYAVAYKRNPEAYDKIHEMSKEIAEYDAQQAELERQQRQAEIEQRRADRQQNRGADKGMDR